MSLNFAGGFEKVSILNILNKVKDSSWPLMGFLKNIVGLFGKDKLKVQTNKPGFRYNRVNYKVINRKLSHLEVVEAKELGNPSALFLHWSN